ncbi:related to Sphingolipid long chain base-responsive protein LSP1 [Saccharomycodes ludwigii]|uniref:Related to Sphingolipid long chain base-responsive protein LSP1 n=1 Tax=Saccharomycodes ludwigii TaxID=36035 RepID=A0A376BAM3_9ASCO|nr:hypothetical protein SCDLUD_000593 [Saccharomycodes ludwigii]KAH3902990.1 hypothetical protein SCDLUD_000593 [Saccharomycodes ludwigii]SSD61651.1 related to Sphingolipid long chain base-responsive protein LSP1 [Saccharomycodes ludwigii]
MNKTYSLRNQRTPTQAQLQNPPPPPSSTRSQFFGKASIGSSFRKNAAANVGPMLSRRLNALVKTEKSILQSWELVAVEKRDAAKQLSLWGMDNDDDVSDVTDKLGVLLYELGDLEDQFIDKYDQYRLTLKSIRNIEASVQPSRDRKQKITDVIAGLKYKDPNSPKLAVLEQELVRAEAESLVAEAQLSNITREKLKASFAYLFDSYKELAEKNALIAGYGKALLELLDDSPVTPGEGRPIYDGYEASKQIIVDAEAALDNWTLDTAQVKPTLSFHQTVDDVYEPQEGEEYYEDEEQEPVEEEPIEEEIIEQEVIQEPVEEEPVEEGQSGVISH